MTDWRTLAARVDRSVSAQFGERIRIKPRSPDDFTAGASDPTRPELDLVAIFSTKDDKVLNLAGDHGGEPLRQRLATGDLVLSIATSDLGDAFVREGDLVEMLDRPGTEYEVNRVVTGATGRTNIHLIVP